jgi:hypothetical protein
LFIKKYNYLSHFLSPVVNGIHLALAAAQLRQARGPRGPEPCDLPLGALGLNAFIGIDKISNFTETKFVSRPGYGTSRYGRFQWFRKIRVSSVI